jgi:hypothetical protein
MLNWYKGLIFVALLWVVAAGGLPWVAGAQCPPPPASSPLAEGEVGVFFDELGTQNCADLLVGLPTWLFVVVRVPEGGIAEFGIPELVTDALPAGVVVLGTAGLPPGGLYDILIVIDGCSQARRPDPQVCPVTRGDLLVISTLQVMAVVPVRDTACFKTACPTIAGTVVGPPVYQRCDTGAWGEFTGWDGMCVGFGVPVPVESSTWGAIKGLYQ